MPNNTARPTIRAGICELNGAPIRPGHPHPVLRRTASGRLFVPNQSTIHAAEVSDARPPSPPAPELATVETVRALIPTLRPFGDDRDEQVLVQVGPAKQPSVIESAQKFSVRTRAGSGSLKRDSVLRRKESLVVNGEFAARKSHAGVLDLAGPPGFEDLGVGDDEDLLAWVGPETPTQDLRARRRGFFLEDRYSISSESSETVLLPRGSVASTAADIEDPWPRARQETVLKVGSLNFW